MSNVAMMIRCVILTAKHQLIILKNIYEHQQNLANISSLSTILSSIVFVLLHLMKVKYFTDISKTILEFLWINKICKVKLHSTKFATLIISYCIINMDDTVKLQVCFLSGFCGLFGGFSQWIFWMQGSIIFLSDSPGVFYQVMFSFFF